MLLLFLCVSPVFAGKSQILWKHYLERHPVLIPPPILKGWFWNTYPTKQQLEAYEAEKDERYRLQLANDLEVEEEMSAREQAENEFYLKRMDAEIRSTITLESGKTSHAQIAVLDKFSSLLAESHTTLERQMNYSRDLNEHLITSMEERMAFQTNMMLMMTFALAVLYLQNHSIRCERIEYHDKPALLH